MIALMRPKQLAKAGVAGAYPRTLDEDTLLSLIRLIPENARVQAARCLWFDLCEMKRGAYGRIKEIAHADMLDDEYPCTVEENRCALIIIGYTETQATWRAKMLEFYARRMETGKAVTEAKRLNYG